jgi:DNA-binding beta-propeller fold protein YncE
LGFFGANGANALFTYGALNVPPSFTLAPPPATLLTGLSGPSALAFDGAGNLYVANYGDGTVSKFSAASLAVGGTTPTATLTGLRKPFALAIDRSDNLYVANETNPTISRFSAASMAAGGTTPTGTLVGLGSELKALVFDRSGHLYVAHRETADLNSAFVVSQFYAGTLLATESHSTTANVKFTGMQSPSALLVDGANNLYVADRQSDSVSKFEPGKTTATSKLTAGVAYPIAMALDRDGTLHVANFGNGTVARFADLSVDISVKARSSFSRTQARDIKAGPAEEVAAGQTVSFTVTTDRQNLFSVPPSIDAAGRLTFTTHYLNFVARVTVIARDSAGASSAPQTFKIMSTGAVGYDCPLTELFLRLLGLAQSSPSTSLLDRVMRVTAGVARVTADVTPEISLATFHALEGVLGESPEGRRLQELYRAHGTEVVQMIRSQPALEAQMNTVVKSFQPLVVSLMSGRGQQVQITQTMIDQLNTMWSGMATMASPELLDTLNTERARHNGFQDFANRDFSQWAQILQVPAPTTPRVNISDIGRPTNGTLRLDSRCRACQPGGWTTYGPTWSTWAASTSCR